MREHQAWLEATIDRLRDDLAGAEHDLGGLRVELARAEERAKAIEAVARGDVEAAKRVVEAELAAKDEVLRELRAQVAREIDRAAAIAVELVEVPAAMVAASLDLSDARPHHIAELQTRARPLVGGHDGVRIPCRTAPWSDATSR